MALLGSVNYDLSHAHLLYFMVDRRTDGRRLTFRDPCFFFVIQVIVSLVVNNSRGWSAVGSVDLDSL